MPYIGAAIRDECGLDDDMRTIAEVPSRSLLSRLTDHYMQIIANRAPVGFEAEFENQRGENICYRGILMPFSSDGDTIDFIYGVINWKKGGAAKSAQSAEPAAAEPQPEDILASEFEPQLQAPIDPTPERVLEDVASVEEPPVPAEHFSWEDGPLADADEEAVPEIALGDDVGLADRLWAARETAEAVKSGEGRTRAALYKALSLAYDFAIAAQADPQEYAELLEESGVKSQARAPMTPVVKLVFGVDYDKTRLTEFAAALTFAQREQIEAGAFQSFIENQPGGLKALVSLERQARQPEPKADTKTEQARAKLRAAAPLSLSDLPSDDEFALVIVRRTPGGGHEPVAVLSDRVLVDRAIRKAV
jgi:hypothetical protein